MAHYESAVETKKFRTVHHRVFIPHCLKAIFLRLQEMEDIEQDVGHPASIVHNLSVGREPVFRAHIVGEQEVVVEINEMLRQAGNAWHHKLDSPALKQGQILLIAAKDDLMVYNLYGNRILEPFADSVFEMRILAIGDDENLPYERGEFIDGSHTPVDFPHLAETQFATNVVATGELIAVSCLIAFFLPDGVVAVDPKNHCIYIHIHRGAVSVTVDISVVV